MTKEGNGVTYKWIVGVVIALLVSVVGYSVAQNDAQQASVARRLEMLEHRQSASDTTLVRIVRDLQYLIEEIREQKATLGRIERR